MLAEVPYGSDAARYTVEVAGVEVDVTVVKAKAAIERQSIERLADGGIAADVKEVVFGYERLFAEVQRLLPHAVHAASHLPAFKFL